MCCFVPEITIHKRETLGIWAGRIKRNVFISQCLEKGEWCSLFHRWTNWPLKTASLASLIRAMASVVNWWTNRTFFSNFDKRRQKQLTVENHKFSQLECCNGSAVNWESLPNCFVERKWKNVNSEKKKNTPLKHRDKNSWLLKITSLASLSVAMAQWSIGVSLHV